ncbi:MAG: ABC transporter substrate-binding protein [Firmicutes bacterium]|nr:ABC transporter substrate-binding protein [Bacillota bacterium]
MNKKLLAILIAMVMALSFLVACNKKPAEETKEPETTTTTEDNKSNEEEKPEDKAEETAPAKDGEVVRRITGSKVATLNQHVYQTNAESDIFFLTLGGLTGIFYDEERDNFKIVPVMAAEMPTRSEDGLHWTFKLRDDLAWPDGTKIDSSTYEYSWKMLLDPKLKNHRGADSFFGEMEVVNARKYWLGYSEDNIKFKHQQEEVKALEELKAEIDAMADGEEKDKKQAEYDERDSKLQANWVEISEEDLAEGGCEWEDVGLKFPDPLTIEIDLAYAMPEVDFWLGFTEGPKSPVREETYEKGMNADRTETTYGTSLDTLDFSGPYVMTEWTRDQYHEYHRNPSYPLPEYWTPDVITQRVVEDANTSLQLFESGETDSVGLSGANYTKYEEDPRIVFNESEGVWCMNVNMTSKDPNKSFLTDQNFRNALYYAINRESIVNDIYKIGIPMATIVATVRTTDPIKGETYRETDVGKALEPANYGYDPELAKEYFDKAYEKFGKQMVMEMMYFDNSANMKLMAEFLEQEFENLFGPDRIDIQLRAVPWNNSYDKMQAGDYDLGFGSWVGGMFNPWSSMEVYTQSFGIKTDQFYSDEFDELYRRTVKGDLIFKPEERLQALGEMEKMLLDVKPVIPIYQTRSAAMFADRVHPLTDRWIPGVGFALNQAQYDPLP